jgi:thioredoxin-dependent peroxiredoxin
MASIQVGSPAPNVTMTTHEGRQISLAEFKGSQAVVLFFYPKDNTPICTREVCSFRDAYADFVDAGAIVIGVSGDSDTTHRSFAETQRLPYQLVADVDGALRRAFGVKKKFGLLPGRVTFVIDREGVVRQVFHSQFSGKKHVLEALQTIRDLPLQAQRQP